MAVRLFHIKDIEELQRRHPEAANAIATAYSFGHADGYRAADIDSELRKEDKGLAVNIFSC